MGAKKQEGRPEWEVLKQSPAARQQPRGDWACWRRHGVSKGGMQCHSRLGNKYVVGHGLVCIL